MLKQPYRKRSGVSKKLTSPRKPRKCTKELSRKDSEKLLRFAKPGREKRLVRLMLATGIHPHCLAHPKKSEIEIVRGKLMWYRVRNKKLCTWTIPDDFMEDMEKVIDDDTGFHPNTYWKIIKRIAERAGLKHCVPLTLRHTACILNLLDGKSYEEVMEILQCSSQVLWNHYAKVRVNIEGENFSLR